MSVIIKQIMACYVTGLRVALDETLVLILN